MNFPKPYVLCIARQEPRKGIAYLIRAAKLTDIPIVVVGDGPLLAANKKLARGTNMKFLGYVRNTKKLLKNAAVFCLPSLEEGAGSVAVVEALAMGVPVVATNCDGIPEDVRDGTNGLLVPTHDPVALARAIATVLRDPKKFRNI